MLGSILNLMPALVRTALVGGAAVNEGTDQVVTQITGASSMSLLLTYIAVAAIELLTRYLKSRSAEK